MGYSTNAIIIHLDNTAEIYEAFTLPAIKAAAKFVTSNNVADIKEYILNNSGLVHSLQQAVEEAAALANQNDNVRVTKGILKQVFNELLDYVAESVQYEINITK